MGDTRYLFLYLITDVDHATDPDDRDQRENAKEEEQKEPTAAPLIRRERLWRRRGRGLRLRSHQGLDLDTGGRPAASTELGRMFYRLTALGAIAHCSFSQPESRRTESAATVSAGGGMVNETGF